MLGYESIQKEVGHRIGDMMIIVTATFVLANPESRPEAVAKAIPLQQATRDGELGCEAYVFSPDPA